MSGTRVYRRVRSATFVAIVLVCTAFMVFLGYLSEPPAVQAIALGAILLVWGLGCYVHLLVWRLESSDGRWTVRSLSGTRVIVVDQIRQVEIVSWGMSSASIKVTDAFGTTVYIRHIGTGETERMGELFSEPGVAHALLRAADPVHRVRLARFMRRYDIDVPGMPQPERPVDPRAAAKRQAREDAEARRRAQRDQQHTKRAELREGRSR